MHQISGTQYLVEWKRLPASEAANAVSKQNAEKELLKLISVLSAVNAEEMYLLRAVHYFVAGTEPTVPFGVVYELPAVSRLQSPISLMQRLEESSKAGNRVLAHSLDQRFELARQIASGILFIHSVGWVHKGIQSSNIWMANSLSPGLAYPEHLGTAFLAGFDYTRRSDATSTGDETVGLGWRRQIYLHPDRVAAVSTGETSVLFEPEFDIYALGVVLVEIGRWEPLYTYPKRFEKVTGLERKQTLKAMADGMRITMGKRYVDVTLRCLQIRDEGRITRRGGPAIRDTLMDLEDLAIAAS